MKKYAVGFIGYGNMSGAIAGSLVTDTAKYLLKREGFKLLVAATDVNREKLAALPKGIIAAPDSKALVEACDVVIIAVKPQQAAEALGGLDFGGKIVVSIMAGVSLSALKKLTAAEKIVRVMPNLNARVECAYSAFCASGLTEEEKNLVGAILTKFGEARETDEALIDAVTGLAGSGPAFVFKFINGLVKNAEKHGFSREVAIEMALATVSGSAELVARSISGGDADIDGLVASVCSKGGTTIEGVKYLDEHDFEQVVSEAVDRAIARAAEMSKQNEER